MFFLLSIKPQYVPNFSCTYYFLKQTGCSHQTIVIRNRKIVWKHWPNRPFYALCWEPSYTKKKKNFMALLYGWGWTISRLEPLQGDSLLFTIKFPEIPGTHLINLDPYFHLFTWLLCFFLFFCQNRDITGLNCAIIGCNLWKKHKLALSQT